MKCEDAETLLAGLVAGRISAEESEALSGHLSACEACRTDLDHAEAGWQLKWSRVPIPDRVREAALSSIRKPGSAPGILKVATGLAAVLCLALLALNLNRRPPDPAAKPPERPPQVLAYFQGERPGLGRLVVRDEKGRPAGELGLKSHTVTVEILDGIAKTTVEENFENHSGRRLEGTFYFPLPPDASISRLALEVNGKIEEGTCVERERARQVFESIVRKMKDPALLEWMPGGIFKCRVFPIEPRSTKRLIVAYTQALPAFRGRMKYVYPLASETTKSHPPEEVRIEVRARFSGTLGEVASPSHRLDVERPDPHRARAIFTARNYRPESDFVLDLEVSDDELRLISHKVDGDDGYFALVVTPRGEGVRRPGRYTFILDISASVSAAELEVAKRLVRAMMERGIEGDRYEILAHNTELLSSGPVDLRAANTFMDGLRPVGASDVLKALLAAPPESEIIYIGEGTPTFGERSPAKILRAVEGRRIRAIAVGSAANVTLLKKVGGFSHVSPSDAVDRRVAEIAATFGSPVIADLDVRGGDAIYDVVGVRDVFFGERLVITGRYRGRASRLLLTGRDYRRDMEADFPAKEEGNNYVRRLWAQRKISDLLAEGGKKDEITKLGLTNQIMTPYTSFLVLESEKMWKDYRLNRVVQKEDEVLGKAGKKGGTEEKSRVDPGLVERYAPGRATLGKLVFARLARTERMNQRERQIEHRALLRLVTEQRDPRLGLLVDLLESRMQNRIYQEVPTAQPPAHEIERKLKELTRALEQESAEYNHMRLGAPSRILEASPIPPPPGNPATAPYDPNPFPGVDLVSDLSGQAFQGRLGPGFSTQESARLESYDLRAQPFHTFLKSDPLTGVGVDPMGNRLLPQGELDEGYLDMPSIGGLYRSAPRKRHAGSVVELHDIRDILIKLQDSPGPKVEPVSPASGSGGPATGATFNLEHEEETVSEGLRTIDVRKPRRVYLDGNGKLLSRPTRTGLAPTHVLQPELQEVRIVICAGGDTRMHLYGKRRHEKQGKSGEVCKVLVEKNDIGDVSMTTLHPDKASANRAVYAALGAKARELYELTPSVRAGQRDTDKLPPIIIDADPETPVEHIAGAVGALKAVGIENVELICGPDIQHDGSLRPSIAEVLSASETPNEVILGADKAAGFARGPFFVITRDSNFVAIVLILEASKERVRGGVWRGLAVGRVLPGDRAHPISDVRGYLGGLPEGVKRELSSIMNIRTMRARMRIGK